jgi:hypothetical protein
MDSSVQQTAVLVLESILHKEKKMHGTLHGVESRKKEECPVCSNAELNGLPKEEDTPTGRG